MAEIKISDLIPKGENIAATDLFVISQDMGGGVYETKSITGDEILGAVSPTAVEVRNQSGATIYKGTIVYISSASGGKALISKAQADTEATSSKTLGVVQADIANNANGNVLTNGLLVGLDTRTTATHPFTTDTLAIGDNIYLSPITAGYITNVKPIAPNNMVSVGKVLDTSSTDGKILYEIINGFEIGELHDVNTTGAMTDDVLSLFADGVWKPKAISSGITIGTTPITSGVAGRVLFEGAGNVVQESATFNFATATNQLNIGASTYLKGGTGFADSLATGWGLYNCGLQSVFNANNQGIWNVNTLSIGMASPTARLDVRAQGALSTDIAFRVRNSADNLNMFQVNGDNSINLLGESNNGTLKILKKTGHSVDLVHRSSNTTPSIFRIKAEAAGGSTGQISLTPVGDFGTTFTTSGFMAGISSLEGSNINGSFGGNACAFIMQNSLGYNIYGTIPSTCPINHFAMYSADITAGNAAPHFRTENGSIIKLYKQDLPTSPTNAELATFLSNLGLANLI